MDFPINLSQAKFVMGLEEFRQTFELYLTNFRGSFMQSRDLGSLITAHTAVDELEIALDQSLESFKGIEVLSRQVVEQEDTCMISLSVKYKDYIENFTFEV